MLKQTIKYKNFNEEDVTEDFYFNFTMLEMIEQVEIHHVNEKMDKLVNTNDGAGAYMLFKGIVLDAFGIKSPDGRTFDKSPAIRHDFENSAAISELIISFLQDADKGIAFIRGVLPQQMLDAAVQAVEAKQSEEAAAKPQRPGLQQLTQEYVAPKGPELRSVPTEAPLEVEEVTAAADTRVEGRQPVDRGVEMTTSEKRMYTQAELDAIQGEPGTVPVAPKEYSDAEVLAMDPQELTKKGLLMRAYKLKTAAEAKDES